MVKQPSQKPSSPVTGEALKTVRPSHRSRRSPRHSGPTLSTVYFVLLALHWIALGTVGISYLRPHPLGYLDLFVGAVCVAVGLFYIWVGYAVFKRRAYIWNIAVACASIWILGFPTGTLLSLLLITNLLSARPRFTK